MRPVHLCLLVVLACGRSAPSAPEVDEPPLFPEPPARQSSALLGHWATFNIGNCINDEAWLSFAAEGTLRVTSVNRDFCGPHSLAAADGTFSESASMLTLNWNPVGGRRTLETSFSVTSQGGEPPYFDPTTGYRLGLRLLSTAVWTRTAARFERVSKEHFLERGETYLKDIRTEVSFNVPVDSSSPPGDCVATLTWHADFEWGTDPKRSVRESFELPCRITVESGRRLVKAKALDTYDGFDRILQSRGLPAKYGWVLDQLSHGFGPDWVVGADENLHLRLSSNSPSFLEMRHGPPETL